MNDEFLNRTTPPPMALRPRSSGSGRIALASALLAFIVGAGGVAYMAWANLLPFGGHAPDRLLTSNGPAIVQPVASPSAAPTALPAAEAALAVRIAALEQRLAQIDLRAQAASGNASRAEGLLVALAARRALDRGSALGYLEDQLRLRFAARHPGEVNTVIDAAKTPVTLDGLLADLAKLAPQLKGASATGDFWQRAQQELSGLFVIRHDDAPSPAPENRIARARLLLLAGKVKEAISEVQAMPGSAAAKDWTAAATRFAGARSALDMLESAALLDTETPGDVDGKSAQQPSPVNAAGGV
ncbi:MAG: hypothetical protein ACKOPO_01475 [Novosphingobium sp.]